MSAIEDGLYTPTLKVRFQQQEDQGDSTGAGRRSGFSDVHQETRAPMRPERSLKRSPPRLNS